MLAAGYSAATVVKRLNLLAAVIQHAISEWDLDVVNHASGRIVKRPEGADKKRNRLLEDSELEQLIDTVGKSRHPDDVWLVRWSIEQGTRRGEAIKLRWGDIDMERRLIRLGGDRGKTKTYKH